MNYEDMLTPPKWTLPLLFNVVGSALLVCSMLFLIVTRYLHRSVTFKLLALAVCVAALNNLVSHFHWKAWVEWPETFLTCSFAAWMLLLAWDEMCLRRDLRRAAAADHADEPEPFEPFPPDTTTPEKHEN
jgi:hypothetical protein